MKTAEKVLLTSLEMFNQHGEANITCVDIAIELDISPGNLYYHFKGKEAIITALFDMYVKRSSKILVSPDSDSLSLAEFFHYLLRLLESVHLFRFIYRNPNDLMQKYPTIERSFKRLINSKEEAFIAILHHFKTIDAIAANESQIDALAQVINLMFTQSQNHFLLTGKDIEQDDISFHCLKLLFHVLAPYLLIPNNEKSAIWLAISEQNI
jgi:AcrR family transcriptional regulator